MMLRDRHIFAVAICTVVFFSIRLERTVLSVCSDGDTRHLKNSSYREKIELLQTNTWDHQRNSTSNSNNEEKTELQTDTRKSIVVMVQGEAMAFTTWASRLAAIPYGRAYDELTGTAAEKPFTTRIELIFATYDRPVDSNDGALMCNKEYDKNSLFSCQTLFIPKSSWTQGRNALARAAWCTQKRQQRNFTYWVFADDDIELHCRIHPNRKVKSVDLPCWQELFRWIEVEAMPLDIPLVGLPETDDDPARFKMPMKTTVVNNFDAIFNAFHSKYLHFFLPYAYMPPHSSWWSSQGVLFMAAQTCAPHMSVSPGRFVYTNPAHRDYARGLNVSEITSLALDNYAPYVSKVKVPTSLDQLAHSWMAAEMAEISNLKTHLHDRWFEQNINGMVEPCDQLRRRFKNFLDRSTMKSGAKGVDMCDILPFMDSYP